MHNNNYNNSQTQTRSTTIKKKVKKHIPKDWLTEARIVYRLGMETLYDLKRTGLVNIVIVTTMAAILTIFGVFFRSAISASTFAHELGNMLEISVYLKPNADANITKKRIKEFEHVETVTIVPKETSWIKLQKEMDLPNIDNPLPDTLHVKVDKPENINSVFNETKQLKSVEEVGYAQDLAKKIEMASAVVNTVAIFVLVVMCILTITIINNTILLVIQQRKEEIEIMRLMGVSNWYIRFPLIMQGAMYGFISAIVALVPVNFAHNWLLKFHQFFMIPSPSYILGINALTIVATIMFIMAIAFGAVGSFLCIKKHLQV